jgi:hypothetical protein
MAWRQVTEDGSTGEMRQAMTLLRDDLARSESLEELLGRYSGRVAAGGPVEDWEHAAYFDAGVLVERRRVRPTR